MASSVFEAENDDEALLKNKAIHLIPSLVENIVAKAVWVQIYHLLVL